MIRKIIFTGLFISSIVLSPAKAETNKRELTLKDTIKDLSIEIPKNIERNLEESLVEWKKSYHKNKDCEQSAQTDIPVSDSIYIERLYSLPSEMELAYNQIVRSYIDMYTSPRRKSSVEYMLGKGKYYFPIIEEVLDKYGLPLELKYLPIIESALNPIAKSRAGATGLWQFMLPTGKMYDLEVNTLVDERKDPRKATEAAARYLKDMYNIYGDWNLVIAAYNCGPGNVNKAIKRSGGFTDYWTIYPYLPKETRGYVPAFIAATYVMNYYPQHNICPMEESYPVLADTVWIDKTLHLKQISESLNITIEDIRKLNPQYQKDIIPGNFKSYPLCLPSRILSEFITKQDEIYGYKTQEYLTHRKSVGVEQGSAVASRGSASKTHKVRNGESLGSIAKKYGVTVTHLKKMNNMHSNQIYAGKNLIVNRQAIHTQKANTAKKGNSKLVAENKKEEVKTPEIGDSDSLNSNSTEIAEATKKDALERNNNEDVRTIYHKVKIGETILQIANKYNVSTKDILAWNKLPSKKAKIGQRLTIKLPESKEAESNSTQLLAQEAPKKAEKASLVKTESKGMQAKVYHVQRGDSLYIIAKRYKGISPKDIMLANNLKNDKLSIGQKLNIPLN